MFLCCCVVGLACVLTRPTVVVLRGPADDIGTADMDTTGARYLESDARWGLLRDAIDLVSAWHGVHRLQVRHTEGAERHQGRVVGLQLHV